MSANEKASEKLKELPHMTDEHLAVLVDHGITTPQKLLAVLKDEKQWEHIHSELKGIGPKTVEKWEEIIEAEHGAKTTEKKEEEKAPAAKKVKKVEKPVGAEKKETKKQAAKKKEKEEGKEEEAEEEAEEKEDVEIVEEGGYSPKQKPKLSAEMVEALRKKRQVASTRPEFYRQEYGRFKRLQTGWRKPRGIHSKTRYKMRYRRPMVNIGYGGPKMTRGLHPSGFIEVRVFNVADLSKITDAEKQAARIAHSVGQRKREKIIEKADELGIRVLNRSGL